MTLPLLIRLALLESSSESLLPVFGRAHVLVVHFPIALLLMAAVAELVHALKSSSGRSPTAFACLGVGAAGAILAAVTGWVHADIEPLGSSLDELLFRHRWLGVATAVTSSLAFFLLAFAAQRGAARKLYRGLLVLSVATVGVGAHYGGSLVYGSNYLFGYREPPSIEVSLTSEPEIFPGAKRIAEGVEQGVREGVEKLTDLVTPGPSVDYLTDVRPIFEARCVECHGPRRQKADLRLDDLSGLFAGERSEWVVLPGDAEGSKLYQRVILPADDEDVMPAKGEPLTAEQIATLRTWIDEGAELPE